MAAWLLHHAEQPRALTAVHVGRIAAAAAVLVPARSRELRLALNAALAASQVLLRYPPRFGSDGSDQAALLAQVAALVARAVPRPAVADAALWFLAAQSASGYGVSGWTKLGGATWRTGAALEKVLRTRTFGAEWAWRLAAAHPRLSRSVAVAVIAVESAFPLVLVGLGRRLAVPFVGAMASFHMRWHDTWRLAGRSCSSPLTGRPPEPGGRRRALPDRRHYGGARSGPARPAPHRPRRRPRRAAGEQAAPVLAALISAFLDEIGCVGPAAQDVEGSPRGAG